MIILRTNKLPEKSSKKLKSQLNAYVARNFASSSKMKSLIRLQKEKKLRDKARNFI
jgi:hypothetical protein